MTSSREVRWLRRAIQAALRGDAPPAPLDLGPAAGLVIQLRGDDGAIQGSAGRSELAQDHVAEEALALIPALIEDPRFPPLTEAELAGLRVELWLLGEERPLASREAFDPRGEAIRVRRGLQGALLLPDTPADWDARAALAYACRLAGLEGRAFEQPETEVHVRSARCLCDEPGDEGSA